MHPIGMAHASPTILRLLAKVGSESTLTEFCWRASMTSFILAPKLAKYSVPSLVLKRAKELSGFTITSEN